MKNLKIRIMASAALFAVCMAALSGCSGISVPSGLTAAVSTKASESASAPEETTSQAPTKAAETSESAVESKSSAAKFTSDTVKAKLSALKASGKSAGTMFLGDSENEAVLDVVLAELGVDEELLKDNAERLVDCGGNDLWFLCFNDDVTNVTVYTGDDDKGQVLFTGENPGFIFIRCFSTGEVPSCNVRFTSTKTGNTTYYPFIVGDEIMLPNKNNVANMSEGIDSFIDVPEETDNTDNTDNTEEGEL